MNRATILTLHGIRCANLPENILEDAAVQRYLLGHDMLAKILSYVKKRVSCRVVDLLCRDQQDCVVITFDDGLISDHEIVLPLLLEYGIKATFFVNPNTIGKAGYCTQQQLLEMSDTGMEIGSHGNTHRCLTTLSEPEAKNEIVTSKHALESMLGCEVVSFAPVGGHYHNWMCQFAKSIGYQAFATMKPGRTRFKHGMFILRRNHIQSHHNMQDVERLIDVDVRVSLARHTRYLVLQLTRDALGMKRFERLKYWLLRIRDVLLKLRSPDVRMGS